MNVSNFIAMLAGGILFFMIVILLDRVLFWPWLDAQMAKDKVQTLTIAFFIGAILSGIVSIRNNR